jgi:hypothetical protein
MRNLILLAVALAFVACEKTIFVGGTVSDFQTGDSIGGIEMGFYKLKPNFNYDDKKFSEMELIATAISNSAGLFSFEIDEDMDISQNVFYYPLPPSDTLSVNALYTPWRTGNSYKVRYGTNSVFTLNKSTQIQFNLINFTQNEIKMRYGNRFSVTLGSINSTYLSVSELIAGQTYKFEFYSDDGKYLGSTSRYINTQLPEDRDKLDWLMPWQIIEIDYNTLEK